MAAFYITHSVFKIKNRLLTHRPVDDAVVSVQRFSFFFKKTFMTIT